MLVLKIIGVILLAITILIIAILLTPVKFQISSKSGSEIKFRLFWGIFKIDTKNNKKTKKLKFNLKETGFKGTFGKSIEITKFLMKQLGKLLSKVKLKRLHIEYVCVGEDAADTAVKYGVLSALVYPFVALLESSMNSKKNKLSVNLNCDFDKKESCYEFLCIVKLRIIYALIVFIKTIAFLTKESQKNEEK